MAPPHSYNAISLEALASVLKTRAEAARQDGTKAKASKVALLLGAGASVSAGIPLARDIVQEVRLKFAQLVEQCEPTYTEYMAQLAPIDRTNLLRKYVDRAQVNAAHLYLAQLVKAGYVDRILTTNFDSLAVQALVLVNERPFVYDLANLKIFKPGQVTSPAVIHLHGQFGGFVNLHSKEEFRKLGSLVHEVLSDTVSERALIAVGYGGLNDPVFQQLCLYGEQYGYDNGLYWISNRDAEPPEHVLRELLQDTTRKAYYLRSYDADSFFMTLVRALGCDPPQIILQPFTFLKDVVRLIGNVKPNGEREDPISGTRKLIDCAIQCHERNHRCSRGTVEFEQRRRAMLEKQAQDLWQKGDLDKLESLLGKAQKYKVPKARYWLAKALEDEADHLLKLARHQPAGRDAGKVKQVLLLYKRAAEIEPPSQEALQSRAVALARLAARARNWRELFAAAFDNFKQATEVEVADRDAYFAHDAGVVEIDLGPPIPEHVPAGYLKWGEALEWMAPRLRGDERIAALDEAANKYKAAAALRPEWHEPLEKWFSVLLLKAQKEPGELRTRTLDLANQVLNRGCTAFRETHQDRLQAARERLVKPSVSIPRSC